MELLHPRARLPEWSTPVAMGCDIYCVGGDAGVVDTDWPDSQVTAWRQMEYHGYVVVPPGGAFLFRTGMRVAIPVGYGCLLWDRSGLSARKLMHRLAGVIDADYRGEWFVPLVNLGRQPQSVKVGDRIVQGVFQRRIAAKFCQVVRLGDTASRGRRGFGSSGD